MVSKTGDSDVYPYRRAAVRATKVRTGFTTHTADVGTRRIKVLSVSHCSDVSIIPISPKSWLDE